MLSKNKQSVAPKKSLSQNFLHSEAHLEQIAELCVQNEVDMIEIGPGTGALTKKVLLLTQDKLYGIEIDPRMTDSLDSLKAEFQNFDYEINDFLKSNIDVADKIVFGNLPYACGSRILLSLLDKNPSKLVFLLQKEVVQRICAIPCTSDYGSMSILVQAFYATKKGKVIPPGCFFPKPKVNSQTVILQKKARKTDFDYKKLADLLLLAFKFKRKKIRNGLYREWPQCEQFVDVDKRPEEIEVDKYIEMSKFF